MIRKRQLLIVGLWLILCVAAARHLVIQSIWSRYAAPGYERDWDFRLICFCITGLRWLIVLLGVVLGIEAFHFLAVARKNHAATRSNASS